MTRTVVAPPGYTLGDGSTAGQVAASRWAAWRWFTSIGVLAVITLVSMSFLQAPSSSRDLSIHNHLPNGARALAMVLRDRGVEVSEVTTLHQAYLATGAAGTIVIADYEFLSLEQIESIHAHDGAVVWLAPQPNELTDIDPALSLTWTQAPTTVSAGCEVPAAQRAVSLTDVTALIAVSAPDPRVTVCFSDDGGASGAYVSVDRPGHSPIHLVSDGMLVSNAALDDDGHAALTLALTGSHPTAIWYVAESGDQTLFSDTQPGGSYFTPTTPSWMGPFVVALVITGFAAALWQGRRMGALVSEPLPVVVRASEATRGRARLYRHGKAHGHASAALRAGAATAMAARLGLPRSSTPAELVAAVSNATGREGAVVHHLLYGAAPTSDEQMIDLVTQLDTLEREVAAS